MIPLIFIMVIPFITLTFAVRQYGNGYENMNLIFYILTAFLFFLTALTITSYDGDLDFIIFNELTHTESQLCTYDQEDDYWACFVDENGIRQTVQTSGSKLLHITLNSNDVGNTDPITFTMTLVYYGLGVLCFFFAFTHILRFFRGSV